MNEAGLSRRDEKLKDDLERAGIAREVSQAALDVDAILQRWRRRVMKRELGRTALDELGLPLDLAQLDVLMAVRAPVNEFGEQADCETTVGTVATRLPGGSAECPATGFARSQDPAPNRAGGQTG